MIKNKAKRFTLKDGHGQNYLALKHYSKANEPGFHHWALVSDADFTVDNELSGEAVDKLGKFEDLEEKGLLIELPVGVGKMLYFKKHEKGEPTGIIVGRKIKSVSVSFEMEGDQYLSIPANRLGVDVFTSIKTAEKILLGGENT